MGCYLALFYELTAVCFLKDLLYEPFTRGWGWNACIRMARDLAGDELRLLGEAS